MPSTPNGEPYARPGSTGAVRYALERGLDNATRDLANAIRELDNTVEAAEAARRRITLAKRAVTELESALKSAGTLERIADLEAGLDATTATTEAHR